MTNKQVAILCSTAIYIATICMKLPYNTQLLLGWYMQLLKLLEE